MPTLAALSAMEILDSRGQPTLRVDATLSDGAHGWCGVPAGASTGAHEAVELRDNEPERYDGRGVLAAVGSVRRQIHDRLAGCRIDGLADVLDADRAVAELDGTDTLSRLGANAAVGVSLAMARAAAVSARTPLWRLVADHLGVEPRLPVPHFNVVNGGAHAANDLDLQEFMIAPVGSPSFAEALRAGAEIYATLRYRVGEAGMPTALGDEGGFALPVSSAEEVLRLLTDAIGAAGYRPGRDGVAIALDPAANGFRDGDSYTVAGERLSSSDLVSWYAELVGRFPIWSIEDGLAEDDDAGWRELTERLGDRVQIVGDDLLVTQADRVRRAADERLVNACLIKPNQAGNLERTLAAIGACRAVGFAQMTSHRSGETVDALLADLAVGFGCGQLKSGAPARGERVAKYNRLLEIEHTAALPYGLRSADVRH